MMSALLVYLAFWLLLLLFLKMSIASVREKNKTFTMKSPTNIYITEEMATRSVKKPMLDGSQKSIARVKIEFSNIQGDHSRYEQQQAENILTCYRDVLNQHIHLRTSNS